MSTRIMGRDKTTGQHLPITQNRPTSRTNVTQFLADIDGVPLLVRFIVGDLSGDVQSRLVIGDTDLHSLLSSTVGEMVDRIGGSSLRDNDRSKRPLATVELIS